LILYFFQVAEYKFDKNLLLLVPLNKAPQTLCADDSLLSPNMGFTLSKRKNAL
jgi:hypothetical protein